MAFKPGNKLGGRTTGSVNRTTKELKEIVNKIIDKNLKTIEADFLQLDAEKRIKLTIDLISFVLPKQKEISMELNDQREFNEITVNIEKN